MTAQLRPLLVCACVAAVGWAAGCLNPRPEDFPSRTVPGSEDSSGEGTGPNGMPIDDPPAIDLPDEPDPTDPPDNSEDPGMVDPSPGFGADAGLSAEAGAPDGGLLDAD